MDFFHCCFQAIKRKLDDIGRKLAILYDLLRESKVCFHFCYSRQKSPTVELSETVSATIDDSWQLSELRRAEVITWLFSNGYCYGTCSSSLVKVSYVERQSVFSPSMKASQSAIYIHNCIFYPILHIKHK